MKDVSHISPLRILEKSSRKGLGKGNLGALVARAGVGKTACLIQIAFHKLCQGEKLVHISLQDGPEKVTSYYNVIFSELLKHVALEEDYDLKSLLERNRLILAYMNQSFDLRRLVENLKNLREKLDFIPRTLIVDGLDFSKTSFETFQGFRDISRDFQVEIWFSVLAPGQTEPGSTKGILHPSGEVDSFFEIILQLEPTPSGMILRLIKDYGGMVPPDTLITLDPNTFLVRS